MSVVIATCTKDYAIIASDRRMVRFSSPKDYEVYSETVDKFIQINKRVIVGFAGDASICIDIINSLHNNDINSFYIDEITKILHSLATRVKLRYLKIHFIICGLNHNNQMELDSFSSNNDFIVSKFVPLGNQIHYRAAMPFKNDNIARQVLYDNFESKLANKSIDENTLLNCMKTTIKAVSEMDNTVNAKMAAQIIYRSKIIS